jgi:hypothetical protein
VPTVTATASPASCGSATALAASGATSYSWSPTTGLTCSTCTTTDASPAATTVYTVTGTDGTGCTGTATASVDGNRIYGEITASGTSSSDPFTVWLIQFNPSDSSIAALDSVTSCDDGTAPYFQFMDKPSGDYLVKAKLNSAVPGTSGYMPTYSASASHWDVATTISHTSGTDAANIAMIYGTVPPGPGFIAGYVVSGAGRGTSGDVPAEGMSIYLKNGTGTLVTFTTTDADGKYAFSNLAEGTYYIYPENVSYYTTPSAVITLAPGSDSATSINFKQHTNYGTITPYDNSKVHTVTTAGVSVYPNPANETLTIGLPNGLQAEATLADMTGRQVLHTLLKANGAAATLSVASLPEGIYLLNIRSASINYTGKVTIGR